MQINELLKVVVVVLSHLNLEELVLLITTLVPLTFGLVAFLHDLTGKNKEPDKEDIEHGSMAQLSARTEAAINQSSQTIDSSVRRLEQQIADLSEGHDTRFVDLHKDLAGVVWELSKLRADMARWQAHSQQKPRDDPRPSAGGAACARASCLGAQESEAAE